MLPKTKEGYTYYDQLGVKRDASEDDIVKAWKQRLQGTTKKQLQDLNDIKKVLVSTEMRKKYDTNCALFGAKDGLETGIQEVDEEAVGTNALIEVEEKFSYEANRELTILCSYNGHNSEITARNAETMHESIKADLKLEREQYVVGYTARGKQFDLKNEMNFEAFKKRPDQYGEYSIVVRRIDKGSL